MLLEKKDAVLKGQPSSKPDTLEKKKIKGHGRGSASDYTGADRIAISHETLNHKDPCPLWPKGKLDRLKNPGVVICLNGQAPLNATVYELEKLRFNLCGKVFTATVPDDRQGKHYDETAKAMIALLKYGCGFPWYRLEKRQESFNLTITNFPDTSTGGGAAIGGNEYFGLWGLWCFGLAKSRFLLILWSRRCLFCSPLFNPVFIHEK